MKTTLNAKDTFEKIEKAAATHTAETRMVRTIAVGQAIRQGDVYLTRIDRKRPLAKTSVTSNRQLAPGSTPGSRHMVVGKVTIYAPKGDDALEGPTIDATERFVLEHPEHAHVSLPRGTYQVTFQRDFASEERARVQD